MSQDRANNHETDKQVKCKTDTEKVSSARKCSKASDNNDLHQGITNESGRRDDDEHGLDDRDDPRGIDRFVLLLDSVSPFD